jgi:hypothetical protein
MAYPAHMGNYFRGMFIMTSPQYLQGSGGEDIFAVKLFLIVLVCVLVAWAVLWIKSKRPPKE